MQLSEIWFVFSYFGIFISYVSLFTFLTHAWSDNIHLLVMLQYNTQSYPNYIWNSIAYYVVPSTVSLLLMIIGYVGFRREKRHVRDISVVIMLVFGLILLGLGILKVVSDVDLCFDMRNFAAASSLETLVEPLTNIILLWILGDAIIVFSGVITLWIVSDTYLWREPSAEQETAKLPQLHKQIPEDLVI